MRGPGYPTRRRAYLAAPAPMRIRWDRVAYIALCCVAWWLVAKGIAAAFGSVGQLFERVAG